MVDRQKKLQSLNEEFQNLQSELHKNVEARQKLESQRQESRSVQKEFAELDGDATIYKLVGPILLRQARKEALLAVDQRLDFIEKEIEGIDKMINATQNNLEKKSSESFNLQASMAQSVSNDKKSV